MCISSLSLGGFPCVVNGGASAMGLSEGGESFSHSPIPTPRRTPLFAAHLLMGLLAHPHPPLLLGCACVRIQDALLLLGLFCAFPFSFLRVPPFVFTTEHCHPEPEIVRLPCSVSVSRSPNYTTPPTSNHCINP
eukprot:RCo050728